VRIIGFINAFDELAEADLRLGRKVANYGLASALMEHSRADEIHFFLPFQRALAYFQRGYAPWLEAPERGGRIRLLPAVKLPVALMQTRYHAFHAAELDRYFPELCHLRNRLAAEPFPVTCTTHTLSYWSTQVRNLYKVLPGPRPWDAVFCTSRAAVEHLRRAFSASAAALAELGLQGAGFAGRLERVPLGVNAEALAGPPRAEAQAQLGLEPGVFTVLYLGRLTPSDKCDLRPLVGLLGQMAREAPVRLILAGSGSRAYAEELVAAAAQFGFRRGVKTFLEFESALKPVLLAACDVFVSPADNLQETFGLSILEAMAAGRPVVASDFSGYRDLVKEGETGFLVPTYGPADYGLMDAFWPIAAERTAALQVAQRTALDLDVLAARLRLLRDRPELARRMGEAGRRRVLRRFHWPVVIRAMEEHWDRLKDEALRLGAAPAPRDVLGAGQGEVFGHFPTRAIAPGDVLAPGPLAGAFGHGPWGREPYPDLGGMLPPAGLELILQELEAAGGRAELREVQARLAGRMPAYLVEHLVLAGLKYGVLSLVGGAEGV